MSSRRSGAFLLIRLYKNYPIVSRKLASGRRRVVLERVFRSSREQLWDRGRYRTYEYRCRNRVADGPQSVKTYICDCVAISPTHEKAEALQDASYFSRFSSMTGTPDEITRKLQAYVDLGFSHLVLRFADYPSTESVELFIDKVLPRFKW